MNCIRAVLRSWVFWGIFLGTVVIGLFIAFMPEKEDNRIVGDDLVMVSKDKKATLVVPNGMTSWYRWENDEEEWRNILFVRVNTRYTSDYITQIVVPHEAFVGAVAFSFENGRTQAVIYPTDHKDTYKWRYELFLVNNHLFAMEVEREGSVNVTLFESSFKVRRQGEEFCLVFPATDATTGFVVDGDVDTGERIKPDRAHMDYSEWRHFYELLDENYRCFDDANRTIYVRLHHEQGIRCRLFAKIEVTSEDVLITVVPEEEIPQIAGTAE